MFRFARLLTAPYFRVLLVLISCLGTKIAMSANQADWERSAYHIQLHLAVETTGRASTDFAANLPSYLEQRIDATLYPLWRVEFSVPTGPFRHHLLTHIETISEATNTEQAIGFDKQMYLTVSATASGYILRCREMDHTTQILGPVLTRTVKQERMLEEQCFQLLCKTFAPLAKVRRMDDDLQHVSLHFKGSALPVQISKAEFVRLGDAYQPLTIRMTRTGEVRPDGINPIPWTYLEIEDVQNKSSLARVSSGTKHPFGVRRRGRVEHLAIALQHPPAPIRVRFYASHNKSQGLMGYEVFRRNEENEKSQLVALTDNQGTVEVAPGTAKITTLFLRSGSELLAKVPVIPGVQTFIEIPIADDIARLNAQATLTSLRERLIDLVARRNILITRTRDQIEHANYDQAKDLLRRLDELPGRAQFAQLISSAENNRRNRSNDPRIQARIEKIFANTRKLLGQFLNSRHISELQSELSAARSTGT